MLERLELQHDIERFTPRCARSAFVFMVPIKSVHSGVLSRPLVSTPVLETFWRRLEQDPRHGARVGYPSEVTPRDTFVPSPVMPGCLLHAAARRPSALEPISSRIARHSSQRPGMADSP